MLKHIWQMRPKKVEGDEEEAELRIRLTGAEALYPRAIAQTRKYLVELITNKQGYLSEIKIIERGQGKYKEVENAD